ncbi:VPLPA-CTERM sorting domain-containing protein [Algirhabdus cladophorae]|uniref:VPLPA-CTERM sorting domain-containing protein n=1 Tax=Algirhabdus cladophorae TaxID=3377108 RepID=UPI003B8482E4
MKYLILAVALMFGSIANAATLNMTFSTTVDASAFGGGTSEAFSASLNFSDQLTDTNTNLVLGIYSDANISGKFSIGSETLSFGGGGIFVLNLSNLDQIGFSVQTSQPDNSITGTFLGNAVSRFSFTIGEVAASSTVTPNLLLSDVIPSAGFSYTTTETIGASISAGTDFNKNVTVVGPATLSIQAAPVVPLPASSPLLIAGLGALGIARRRKTAA